MADEIWQMRDGRWGVMDDCGRQKDKDQETGTENRDSSCQGLERCSFGKRRSGKKCQWPSAGRGLVDVDVEWAE